MDRSSTTTQERRILQALRASVSCTGALQRDRGNEWVHAEASLVAQVSRRECENNALPEAQVHASFEQLSVKEDELRHARSAQRLSDARVGAMDQTAFEVDQSLESEAAF